MAEIKAFRGLRYTGAAGGIATLCCPPYDIISKEQSKIYHNANPYNVIRLELPRSLSDDPAVDVYAESGKFLRSWLSDGILKNDDAQSIYVYELGFDINGTRKKVAGFIPLVRVEDIAKGIVLPHEETLSKDKSDRLSLMEATGCNFSQIYSLFDDDGGEIDAMLAEAQASAPASSFTDSDNVSHTLWAVSEPAFIDKIVNLMNGKKLYIADGHHRYETALAYRDLHSGEAGSSDYVPMFLVNMDNDGLVILPTHRIVRDLKTFDRNEIINKSGQYFDIMTGRSRTQAEACLAEAAKNGDKALVMYTGDNDYTFMKLKSTDIMKDFMPGTGEALRNLDVSVLHTLVLERILGIDKENMANQINLTYTRSTDEAISAIDQGKGNCAFLLNPCGVGEIGGVVSAGGKMPQKSTYFYPKLTTGLAMNQIVK
jgi:uncharacterized protein (DUF1015 family)